MFRARNRSLRREQQSLASRPTDGVGARLLDISVLAFSSKHMHCLFYLSGPNAMVEDFEDVLNQMNIRKDQIKKDYFPGFA